MKISLAQTDVSYRNPEQNIQHIRQLLDEAETIGDLTLLPELFTSGYLFDNAGDIHQVSENFNNSKTISVLTQLAAQYDTLIVAGIPERDGDYYFNAVAVVDAHGLKYRYRKISQTNIDKQYFQRGDHLTVFEHQGLTFGIAICFDLWFPEIIRAYALAGVDVLLHPANFGGQMSFQLAHARALENAMHVVTCNRIGTEVTKEVTGDYCGESQVCAPDGSLLLKLEKEQVLATTDINPQRPQEKTVLGVPLISEANAITHQLPNSQPFIRTYGNRT